MESMESQTLTRRKSMYYELFDIINQTTIMDGGGDLLKRDVEEQEINFIKCLKDTNFPRKFKYVDKVNRHTFNTIRQNTEKLVNHIRDHRHVVPQDLRK